MKANGVALALQHCALEIVVEQDTRTSVPGREGADVTTQEVLHAGIEEEAQKNLARVAQHHDEGHQGTARAAYHEVTKMPPVDLPLLAGQAAQTQIGLRRRARPMTGDEVAEVIAAAAVAAFAHHRVQPAGGQRRELLQGLMDEGQIGLDLRATCRRPDPGQTGLGQDPRHGAVVHMQLAGDRANAPFLDMIIAQDLRLQIGRDGHAVLLDEVWRRIEPVRRRRNSRRTNGGQRHSHQWQDQLPER